MGGRRDDRAVVRLSASTLNPWRAGTFPLIAKAAGTTLETLYNAVIEVPALYLDHRADRQCLVETVERVRSRLAVLDPSSDAENTVCNGSPNETSEMRLLCSARHTCLARSPTSYRIVSFRHP